MEFKQKNIVEANKLYKMPFNGINTPHVVIEVNQKCNISCKACYKDKFNYTKPLDEIKNEIDFAIGKRNLHVITLAGGEPTLHPDLPEIIKYISEKGILVSLLSNGFALTDRKLKEYKEAKLTKIYLHIDANQTRSDLIENPSEQDLIELRASISKKILSHKIQCALEVTLYQSTLTYFKDFIGDFFTNRLHQKLLVTCCTNLEGIACLTNPKNKATDPTLDNEVVTNKEVISYLYENFKLLPYSYIPSNKDDNELRWLFYLTFVIQLKNGKTKILHTNTHFKHIAKKENNLFFKITGKYPFDIMWSKKQLFSRCLMFSIYSLNPLVIFKTLLFLTNLLKSGSYFSFKSMCFQQFPNLTLNNEIEICKDCPDITVRNNKLVPVCLVDIVD